MSLPVLAELDIEGIRDAVVEIVQRLYRGTSDDVLDAAQGILVASAMQRIDSTKRAPDGTPWAPWSAAYARVTKSRSLLYGTGRMLGSIDAERTGPDELTLFADTPYAATQNFGRDAIPAREFLGMSDDDAEAIASVMADYYAEVFA